MASHLLFFYARERVNYIMKRMEPSRSILSFFVKNSHYPIMIRDV